MTNRFVIISPARSGSTTMRLTANSYRQAVCHGEILGRNRVLGISHKISREQITTDLRQADPDRFLQMTLSSETFPFMGFKALYGHFFLEQNAYFLNRVLAGKPQVIFLWRRDLVRRFRSDCLLRVEKELWRPARFARVQPEEIIIDARLQMSMAAGIHRVLEGHGIREVMTLDFEDLIRDPQISAQAMEFIGLPGDQAKLVKDKRTRRNEARATPIDIPPVFDAPAVDHLRDVSLASALEQSAQPL